jgi:urease accessory protein
MGRPGLHITSFTTAVAAIASPVMAHDASLGDQMLQPVTAAQSLLPLLAVGLVCRQNDHIQIDRLEILILGVGLALGLAAQIHLGAGDGAAAISLVLACIAGGMTAIARPVPAGATSAIVFALGLAVGANLHVETSSVLDVAPALAAASFATIAVLLLITETARSVTHDWHAIALRVAGSWIVAIAVISLARSLRDLA